MCRRTFSLFWLLTAGMVLATGGARAQDATPPPDPIYPFPLYHDRPETGGLFLTGGYAMYRQTNPLKSQAIGFRGFFDTDGANSGQVGKFIGSATVALNADQASGPNTYQPGFRVSGGWRFENGISLEVSWLQLLKANYPAAASLVPFHFLSGKNLADSFLSAPVYNFPPEYSGPEVKAPALGNPLLTVNQGYGIWNAADVMSEDFIQRYQQMDIGGRIPIFETDCCRVYGLVGFRFAWIWERFRWRTVDSGFFTDVPLDPSVRIDPISGQIFRNPGSILITTTLHPDPSPSNAAIYTNIVSNRMYGPTIGCGNEWYLGHGFAVGVDVGAALFIDIVKERAKYELGDKEMPPQSKRARTQYEMVPELTGDFKIYWYPIEGVQVQIGYNIMSFFNTIAAPEPVSFNYGGLDPNWKNVYRFFDGFEAGVGFIF
jgi:hypothetical protein